MQLLRSEKAVLRHWTEKLPAGSDLHMKSDGRLRHNKTRSRHRNLTQLISVSHNEMPALQGMPVAQAELNFHEYASTSFVIS